MTLKLSRRAALTGAAALPLAARSACRQVRPPPLCRPADGSYLPRTGYSRIAS